MKIKILFFLCLLPFLLFAKQNNNHFITKTSSGTIDWSTGIIEIQGYAKIPEFIKNPDDPRYDANNPEQPRNEAQAKLLAKNQAKENAILATTKLIKTINVDNEKTIGDYMNDPAINSKINNFVNDNFKITDIEYTDEAVIVYASYFLYGEHSLLNQFIDGKESDIILFNYEKFVSYPLTNNHSYAGLVISAPDIEITPALNPKIYSENGNLIYDSRFIEAKPAVSSGIVNYGKTPFNLLKEVNLQYYHCSAIKTTTFDGCDIVISDEDAKTLLSNPETINNLKKAKVIILSSDKKKN